MTKTKRPRTNTAALSALRTAIAEQCSGDLKHAAGVCEINRSVLSSIKSGKRVPGRKDKDRIEKGLGVSVDLWPVVAG